MAAAFSSSNRMTDNPLCLIVDDSLVTRLAGKEIITSFGFDCDEAVDGMQALDFCRQTMPQAILLDWNMPRMSGYDFLLALRDIPAPVRPIVIFCTSEQDSGHIAQALNNGADEYVIKPFDAAILRDKFMLTGLLND